MTGVAALELSHIVKRFGDVDALADASLRVLRGSVHALLGENGAGKTTLMRVAFGMVRPESGSIFIDGSPVTLSSAGQAIRRGIGMVHQRFTIVGAMTVAENVALGGSGTLRARAAADRVRAIGREMGLVLEPDAPASTLPASAQQRLEIVKALAHGARTLILDEPTAVLAPAEVEDLMRFLRSFADDGGAVVLITHKLREAMGIADEVTVLRAGRTVAVISIAAVTESALAQAMMGDVGALTLGVTEQATRETEPETEEYSRTDSSGRNTEEGLDFEFRDKGEDDSSAQQIPTVIGVPGGGAPRLQNTSTGSAARLPTNATIIARAHGVSVIGESGVLSVRGVSLSIRAGEILGFAGVEGAGYRELLRAFAGITRPLSGLLEIPDRIAFIPELSQREGLVLEMSLMENLALRGAGKSRVAPQQRISASAATERLNSFGVRATSPRSAASTLSGGNQQKLVLARELWGDPTLIVAENPTRGLDIVATAAVHGHLRAAALRGAAVVFHSADLDELVSLASRVVVFFAGSLREVPRHQAAVGAAMLGVT